MSNSDSSPIITAIDCNLGKTNFKLWRNVSWENDSEVALFAFRNVLFPLEQSQNLFLKEQSTVSSKELETFVIECLNYAKRTKPKLLQSRLITQYMIIAGMVAERFDEDALTLVRNGVLSHSMTSEMRFPVLINKQSKEVIYFKGLRVSGLALYLIARSIVEKLLIPAVERAGVI